MGRNDPTTGRAGAAVVIGAGIGGLAAAVGLHRAGWSVTVLEQAPAIGEVGAGLSLWPNAVRALAALGLDVQVRSRAVETVSRGNLRSPNGTWLRRSHPDDATVLVLHRAELHRVLTEALPAAVLRTDATVTGVDDHGDRVTVAHRTSSGVTGEVEAEVVIAADGIGSVVRNRLLPGHAQPSFRGRTVWRGLTPPGSVCPIEPSVTVGRGVQFGMLPLPDRRLYWFLMANADTPGVTYDDERAEVRRRVGTWHDPIPRIVDATPADQVLHHDVVDLDPLPTYAFGRVALLGDAAHAMTPDLGQGACQALEDAVVVVSALRSTPDLAQALATYDRQRRPRTQEIARAARDANARNMNESAVFHALTGLTVRLLPAGLWRRATARWIDWTPPAGPA